MALAECEKPLALVLGSLASGLRVVSHHLVKGKYGLVRLCGKEDPTGCVLVNSKRCVFRSGLALGKCFRIKLLLAMVQPLCPGIFCDECSCLTFF